MIEKIKITTGTYKCSDYRIIKRYRTLGPAMKFLKAIGYPFDRPENHTWSNQGRNYTLSKSN